MFLFIAAKDGASIEFPTNPFDKNPLKSVSFDCIVLEVESYHVGEKTLSINAIKNDVKGGLNLRKIFIPIDNLAMIIEIEKGDEENE